MYNRLVLLRNQYKNGYSQIDVQLKRRYDLIPNLVETAKGYMNHERTTLEAVVAARNAAVNAGQAALASPGDAGTMKALAGAESQLTGALGRLFALAESYPDLKANTTMQQLMEELTSTENKVGFARQAYNDFVMKFNVARQQFPSVLIANAFGFTEATELFSVTAEAERASPKVSF
jgi:LemA protein